MRTKQRYFGKGIFLFALITLLIFTSQTIAQHAVGARYSVDQIPFPKEKGQQYFVSNPDGVLSNHTVDMLNSISQSIDEVSTAEYAIVIVKDYNGDSDFEFAQSLFNKWGIGKEQSNNGLLLFIAKDRREYRFISGYGMERIFPDAYLKRAGEKYLVPNFRNGDYDKGVLEVSEFIGQILKSPDSVKELEAMMPEAIPFWSWRNPILKNSLSILGFCLFFYIYIHFVASKLKGSKKKLQKFAPLFYGIGCMGLLMFITLFIFAFLLNNFEEVYQVKNLPYFAFVLAALILAMKITTARKAIGESYVDEEDKHTALKKFALYSFVPILLSPLAWIDFGLLVKYFGKNNGRFTAPDHSGDWERIKRTANSSELKKYLDSGQQKEEKIRGRKYEIWRNTKSGKIEIIPWEINNKFKECPQCHYFTLEKSKHKVLKNATYSASGKGEIADDCSNCNYYKFIMTYTIPKKTRSSGGSSGGSSSSGGGSSSSSGGGSFGGGSSGGGGAGGRW